MNFTKTDLVWKHKIVFFVIQRPHMVLIDDSLWKEFYKYSNDLMELDDFDRVDDRQMYVEYVKDEYLKITKNVNYL